MEIAKSQRKYEQLTQNSQDAGNSEENVDADSYEECPVSRNQYEQYLKQIAAGGEGKLNVKRKRKCNKRRNKKRTIRNEEEDGNHGSCENFSSTARAAPKNTTDGNNKDEEAEFDISHHITQKSPKSLPITQYNASVESEVEDNEVDDDNNSSDEEEKNQLAHGDTFTKPVPKQFIVVPDDDDDDDEEDEEEEDNQITRATQYTKNVPIIIDDDEDDDDEDDDDEDDDDDNSNMNYDNQVTIANKSTTPVRTSSNIHSTSHNVIREMKKANKCSSHAKPKVKNLKPPMKYIEMEAEDKDKCSNDDDEDSDEDSEDDRFIEDDDESSEEEGEVCSDKELLALQPHLWNNHEKIAIPGKPSELGSLQYHAGRIIVNSPVGRLIIRMYENILGNTFFHVFLLQPGYLPGKGSQIDTSKAERLDFNIIIEESIKTLDSAISVSIRSFLVYNKFCAVTFIKMIFAQYPKVTEILFPSSHKGLETAIKKNVFNYLNGEYFFKRPEHGLSIEQPEV